MISAKSLTGATTIQFLTEEEKGFIRRCEKLSRQISYSRKDPFLFGWLIACTGAIFFLIIVPNSITTLTLAFTLLFPVWFAVATLLYICSYRELRRRRINELYELKMNSLMSSAFSKLREYDLIRSQFAGFEDFIETMSYPPRWAKGILPVFEKP